MKKKDHDLPIHQLVDKLERLRDEARVRLHLAGMTVKDEWSKLEPDLEELQKSAKAAGEASRKALLDMIGRVEKVLERDEHHTSP